MMSPEEYEQIQAVFLRLRDLPPEAREVEAAKLSEIERAEVLSLLAANDSSAGFLDMTDETSTEKHNGYEPAVPKRIGAYRLLQKLGEGGFGSVYMAEQTEPVHRKVALKLIKPGMDSKQVLARFQAERQALAMMNHSSIAQFFDVGATENGLPFFVMELVRGTPIDKFCEANSLKTDERLRLFSQVCDAVHHAHRKGVIHRDLKPSNVLVSMGEEKPIAKVIDFGIAKALESRLTDATLFTEFGQIVGTLEYMSPEQAEMSTVDIDTRSDVYSLGVLLYQLLTGSTPISRNELLKNGLFELPRVMRETIPPKPSDRLAALHRHSSRDDRAKPQERAAQGELDWITLKCLAKDRRERYDSTRELADDIRRYLERRPVSAHPPTLGYRLSKFVQRNIAVTLVSLVVASSLLLGLVGLGMGWRQATAGRRVSEESKKRLNAQMYGEMINLAWRSTQRNDTRRAEELLDACSQELRGWEWSLVRSAMQRSAAPALRQSGKSAIKDIAIGANGKLIAVALAGGTVEIRAADSDRRIESISIDGDATSVAMDEERLVIGSVTGSLSWHRLHQGRESAPVRVDRLSSGGIYDVQFSPDGEKVAVSTGAATLQVIDASTGDVTQKWELPSRLSEVCFLDRSTIAGAGRDGTLYFAELGNAGLQSKFVSGSSLNAIKALSREQVYLLGNGNVLLFDRSRPSASPVELTELQTLGATQPSITCLATSADGILACSANGTAAFLSFKSMAESLREPVELADLGVAMTTAVWDETKNRFVCGLADGRIASLAIQYPCTESAKNEDVKGSSTTDVEVFSNESLVFFATASGDLQISELDKQKSGQLESVVKKKLHHAAIWNIDTDREQKTLVSVGEDFKLRCWDVPSLEMRFEAPIQFGARDVCLAPDSTWIAAAPKSDAGVTEGTIGIWDPVTGSQKQLLEAHRNWVLALSATPDGQCLVSSSEDRTVRIWDTQTWEVLHLIEPAQRAPATHLAFGKQSSVFLGHRDGWVTEWSLTTGRKLSEWAAFGDVLTSVSSLDDRLIVTSRSSSLVKVYDTSRAKLVAEINLKRGPVQSFLPNERFYISCGANGSRQIGQISDRQP